MIDIEKITPVGMGISLFIILNAVGQIPLFLSVLSPFSVPKQRKIILREMLIALAVLLLFTFFGNEILTFVGISRSIIGIAGGILLFLFALEMIFPHKKSAEGFPSHEPLVIPLAIPAIAGPGSITLVMLFSHKAHNTIALLSSVLIAWLPSLLILLLAINIKKVLGEKGLMAVERFGGLLVCLIGIQMFTTGVIGLIKENFIL